MVKSTRRITRTVGIGAALLFVTVPANVSAQVQTQGKTFCWLECYDCGGGGAMFWDDTMTQSVGDLLYERTCTTAECGGDNCDFAMQDVVGFEEQIGALAAAVEARDESGIRAALQVLTSVAELNTERGALQVTGCNDQIVAHIPLSSTIMAAIGG